jgi:superfamily II DNA or RNA helicase
MATGSGKTITALAIATELYQKIGLQVLLVVCPYRHLVTQWARECHKFGLEPILAFENVHSWQSQLSTALYNVCFGNQPFHRHYHEFHPDGRGVAVSDAVLPG